MDFTNRPDAAPPLTAEAAEAFQAMVDGMLEAYRSGRMVVVPYMYDHATPCCGRMYQTDGLCADDCPYGCGGAWVAGYCPVCKAIKEWLEAKQ